jgi:hypothetical protein
MKQTTTDRQRRVNTNMHLQPAANDEIRAEIYRSRLEMLAECGNDLDSLMQKATRFGKTLPNPRVSYVEEAHKPKVGQQHEPVE